MKKTRHEIMKYNYHFMLSEYSARNGKPVCSHRETIFAYLSADAAQTYIVFNV